MSGERFIIVDTAPTAEEPERYLGLAGWHRTIRAADPFYTESDAERHAQLIPSVALRNRVVVRRVVPAGTKRARAASQADADNVATMRAELEGLRATDEEMAAKLAQAQSDARDAETRAAGWESAYTTNRAREDRVREALGAAEGEPTDEAAKRVAAERDEARRDLAELHRDIKTIAGRVEQTRAA